MTDLVVYTLPECPNCITLKEFLSKNGAKFREEPMDTAESITEMRVNQCFAMMAPVLRVDDNFYEDLFKGGKFDENRARDLAR